MFRTVAISLTVAMLVSAQGLRNGNQAIVGTANHCAPAGGSDTYACTITGLTALTTGGRYSFLADVANTGAASINFTSLGAKTIKKVQGGVTTDLADNDIRAGQVVSLMYDGTNMQMVSQLGNAPAGAAAAVARSFEPWGNPGYMTTGSITGAGIADIIQFSLPAATKFVAAGFHVTGAATSNCNGGAGACGGSAGIYSWNGTSFDRVCLADPVYTGHTTPERNIGSTESKRFVWSSGSAFTGGYCELAAGNWYYVHTFESTALAWSVHDAGNIWYMMNTYSGAIRAPSPGRFRTTSASVSSGTGATYSVPSNISASFQVVARKLPYVSFYSE